MFQKKKKKKKEKKQVSSLKAPYSSKTDMFSLIQERFNKLIYSINTIIKCGI